MKKIIALVLVVVLTASVSILGTLAYLTDRDSKANVFTVGDVEIRLDEEFEQGSELIPGVDINKDVQITNTGKNDAWVWYTYAVPTALVDTGNNASKNAIHFNLEGEYWDTYASEEQKATGKTWHWEDIEHNVTIDDSGIPYTVVTVLYNTTLVPEETTPVSLTNVYLDKRVDITPEGDMYWVENGVATDLSWNVNEDGAPTIFVSAYAIQADGFKTVQEAYAAYQKQWGDNGSEWGSKPEGTVTPAYAAENNGKNTFAKIWGEATTNAEQSLVVKVYSGDTYMGETSLNNIGGIIDGDVHVTWSILLDAESNTDEYWTMSWEKAPSLDLQPTKVELWADGLKVAENTIKLNSPDDLKPIVGAVIDANSTILRYVVNADDANLQAGEAYVDLTGSTNG